MSLQVVHYEYFARIALEIMPQHGLIFPEVSASPWWVSGAKFSCRGTELLVHRYVGREPPPLFLFLDEVADQQQIIEYIIDLYKTNNPLPDGGLVFIDQATSELVETNWDLGETEEWQEILDCLLATGSVLHTFSATDAAIEVRFIFEGVSLQNLNWEALPDRLESSRQTEPCHIFKDQDKFIAEVHRCLAQLATLLTNAQTLPEEWRATICDYLSTKHRRSLK